MVPKPSIFNLNLYGVLHCVVRLFFGENKSMGSAQIERLKKDSRHLEWAAAKYRKQGRTDRMAKVLLKKVFLDEHIAEIQQSQLTT